MGFSVAGFSEGSRFGLTGLLALVAGAATIASATDPTWLAIGVIAAGTSAGGAWAPFSDAIADKVPTIETRRALSLVNAGSPVGLVAAASGDGHRR